KRARAPEIIPVSVSGAPGMDDGRPLSDDPVTLFLPGGIRMCCQPSQLTDVFRVNRPGFPGECFICELRLPDHRF
ncbi:hypothetical protein UZ470_26220, partial [Escherichia coli]|nr:hypothetical protein [Escherichia coli]